MRNPVFRSSVLRAPLRVAFLLAFVPCVVRAQTADDPATPIQPDVDEPVATAPGPRPAPSDVVRRSETLARLRAKYPNAGTAAEAEPGVPGRSELPELKPDGVLAAAPPTAQDRILAGHLLRRISFGATPTEVANVLRLGRQRYVDSQLGPGADAPPLPPPPKAKDIFDDTPWLRRWYARMTLSHRQLLERMVLIWHEHFATSNDKVGVAFLMHKQEDWIRRQALRNFKDLLTGLITDQAMLYWLDNNYNDGNATDDDGKPVLPNANFAREFLQLFTMGPTALNMDGTPILDTNGDPVPNYTEGDIKEIARALTGWHVDDFHNRYSKSFFDWKLHDDRDKVILGTPVKGRLRGLGALEVGDVVKIVMAHPSVPPFISKILIQKLATETPTPGYVERVATVFQKTKGDIRLTVRAILLDPEFTSDAVVRTQWKEPIEYFVGPARALAAKTKGDAFIDWTFLTQQLVYYPPSVFSFYPPGQKKNLITTATDLYRDRGADELAAGFTDTHFDTATLIRKYKLTSPEATVDFVSDALLVAPLPDDVRAEIVSYMEGRVDDEKFKGVVWLVMCTPDFQRN